MKFGGRFFQTKVLSRLSHKVCRRLSSPALLCTFTNIKDKVTFLWRWGGNIKKRPSFSARLAMQAWRFIFTLYFRFLILEWVRHSWISYDSWAKKRHRWSILPVRDHKGALIETVTLWKKPSSFKEPTMVYYLSWKMTTQALRSHR